MRQEYELIYKFQSQSDQERAEKLFQRLLEHKRHLQRLEEEHEGDEDDGSSSSLH